MTILPKDGKADIPSSKGTEEEADKSIMNSRIFNPVNVDVTLAAGNGPIGNHFNNKNPKNAGSALLKMFAADN